MSGSVDQTAVELLYLNFRVLVERSLLLRFACFTCADERQLGGRRISVISIENISNNSENSKFHLGGNESYWIYELRTPSTGP